MRRALVDDARAGEAAVPPAMESRAGKRLAAVLPDHRGLRAALLGIEEMFERVAPEREFGDLLAQLLGRDRCVPDLAALPVHAEAPAAEVEVASSDRRRPCRPSGPWPRRHRCTSCGSASRDVGAHTCDDVRSKRFESARRNRFHRPVEAVRVVEHPGMHLRLACYLGGSCEIG